MAHIVNLAQGAFIKGLSAKVATNPETADANDDDKEAKDDVLKLIAEDLGRLDECHFPVGSLLYKICALVAKVCASTHNFSAYVMKTFPADPRLSSRA